MTDLIDLLRKAPFAFHSEADVEKLIADLPIDPASVAEALESDARCHEQCDNWIKAHKIHHLAARVRALA